MSHALYLVHDDNAEFIRENASNIAGWNAARLVAEGTPQQLSVHVTDDEDSWFILTFDGKQVSWPDSVVWPRQLQDGESHAEDTSWEWGDSLWDLEAGWYIKYS